MDSYLVYIKGGVLDGILANAIFAAVGFVVSPIAVGVYKAIKSRWSSDINLYVGRYYCYRWATVNENQKLVEPTVTIERKNWFSPYVLKWITPDNVAASFPLIQHIGREIYAYGRNHDLGSYSSFVLHPTHTDRAEIISGMYLFMNMSHEFVSGSFLLSRRKLPKDQVEALLPTDNVRSAQWIAFERHLAHERMLRQLKLPVKDAPVSEP